MDSSRRDSNDRGAGWHWAWLAVLAVGCSGDGLLTSTGSVSYDGKPVADGAISFHPIDATSAPQGGLIVGGRFRVRTRPGRYRVEIRATRPQAGGVELTPGATPREQYIPSRYNDESTLEAEVTPQGANTFTFDLASNCGPSATQAPPQTSQGSFGSFHPGGVPFRIVRRPASGRPAMVRATA